MEDFLAEHVCRPETAALLGLASTYLVGQTVLAWRRRGAPKGGDAANTTGDASEDGALSKEDEARFNAFQRRFLLAYCLAMFGDWVQSPYLYVALAEFLPEEPHTVAQLFVACYAASGVCSVLVAPLTDRFGRRRAALLYTAAYAASALLLAAAQARMEGGAPRGEVVFLLVCRSLLAGLAVMLLYSVFDAWMATEHLLRGYPPSLLGDTYNRMAKYNSATALIASAAAYLSTRSFGRLAPFYLALASLLLAGLYIAATWPENFGSADALADTQPATEATALRSRLGSESAARQSFKAAGDLESAAPCPDSPLAVVDARPPLSAAASALRVAVQAVGVLRSRPEVLLVGMVQCGFESALFVFIVAWTPALPATTDQAVVFAAYMVAVAVGTLVAARWTADTSTTVDEQNPPAGVTAPPPTAPTGAGVDAPTPLAAQLSGLQHPANAPLSGSSQGGSDTGNNGAASPGAAGPPSEQRPSLARLSGTEASSVPSYLSSIWPTPRRPPAPDPHTPSEAPSTSRASLPEAAAASAPSAEPPGRSYGAVGSTKPANAQPSLAPHPEAAGSSDSSSVGLLSAGAAAASEDAVSVHQGGVDCSAAAEAAARLPTAASLSLLVAYNVAAAVAFGIAAYQPGVWWRLGAFSLQQVCAGVHYASFYATRALVLPQDGRVTLQNLFDLPTKAVAVAVLLAATEDAAFVKKMLWLCAVLCGVAAVCASMLSRRIARKSRALLELRAL